MKQSIIIMGPPGVGKTTICKFLYQQMNHAQYLDADDCWRIHPFDVNVENKKMVEGNIKAIYHNFLDNPQLKTFIFSWVVASQELFSRVQSWFEETALVYILLECEDSLYKKRLLEDKRNMDILIRLPAMKENYSTMNLHRIDITTLTVEETAHKILNIVKQENEKN